MNNPSKKILHIQGQASLLTYTSVQDAPPQGATQLHDWAKGDGRRSALGMHPLHCDNLKFRAIIITANLSMNLLFIQVIEF